MGEHIGVVTNRIIAGGFTQQKPAATKPHGQARIEQERMKKLWSRMIHIYGFHKWTTTYTKDPNKTWSQACARLSPEMIGVGLESCMNRTDPWPPTLPEFLQGCYRPASPKKFSCLQIEHKDTTYDSPESKAYMDCNKDMSPGDPGYKEYFNERVAFHTADMGE